MQAKNFFATTSSITPTLQQVATQTATPVVEVVLGVAAAAPCDLAVLVEETVRCLTGTTEGGAGVEGAVTAGTELLPPVSTSTRLTGKTNGFMYNLMKQASSEIKVKSLNNENS